MCTVYHVTYDGHDYTLRVSAQDHMTTIHDSEQHEVGTIETSPCGEYFIACSTDNPLGMASHYHVGSATLDEVAQSVISGGY